MTEGKGSISSEIQQFYFKNFTSVMFFIYMHLLFAEQITTHTA